VQLDNIPFTLQTAGMAQPPANPSPPAPIEQLEEDPCGAQLDPYELQSWLVTGEGDPFAPESEPPAPPSPQEAPQDSSAQNPKR
jgi:hypothetical protein